MSRYITQKKGLFLAYFLLTWLTSAGGIGFAFVLSGIINQAAAGNMQGLLLAIGRGIFFVLTAAICGYLYDRVSNRLLYYARIGLKNDLFCSYFQKNTMDYERKNSAEYLNEITNNVNIFSEVYFTNVLQLPVVILVFAAAVVLCIAIEPVMLLVILCFSVAIALVSRKCGQALQNSTEALAKGTGRYLAVLKDYFAGWRLIQGYHRSAAVTALHEKENREAERLREKNSNIRSMYSRVNELMGLVSTLSIMGVAGVFAVRGSFAIGIVFAFGQLAGKIMSPIMEASNIYVQLKSAKTLRQDFEKSLTAGGQSRKKEKKKAEFYDAITVRELGFSYPNMKKSGKVLDAVNMTFYKGGKYLITGQSGAGKSTFLSLLAGMYDNYEGSLRYDDVEVRDMEEESLHALVSVVEQEAFLFHDTLKNNITLYDDSYEEEEIWRALRLAGLEKKVKELSENGMSGLSVKVSENGGNFSGGEKQRINLARAILRGAPVLLLDEFTASLDEKTAEEVERAVLALEGGTILFVTHKVNERLAGLYDGRYEIL